MLTTCATKRKPHLHGGNMTMWRMDDNAGTLQDMTTLCNKKMPVLFFSQSASFFSCGSLLSVAEPKLHALHHLQRILYELTSICFHRNVLMFDGTNQKSQISKLVGARITSFYRIKYSKPLLTQTFISWNIRSVKVLFFGVCPWTCPNTSHTFISKCFSTQYTYLETVLAGSHRTPYWYPVFFPLLHYNMKTKVKVFHFCLLLLDLSSHFPHKKYWPSSCVEY